MKSSIKIYICLAIALPWFLQAQNIQSQEELKQVLYKEDISMNTTKVDKTRLSQEAIELKLNEAVSLVKVGGIYFHFKHPDNLYKILGVCLSADSLEPMVIYQALYGVYGVWTRPLAQWLEQVEVDGKKMNRFTFVEKACNSQSCEDTNCA